MANAMSRQVLSERHRRYLKSFEICICSANLAILLLCFGKSSVSLKWGWCDGYLW